jgi:xanthine dehydrogenase YagR molybdenum-binding subunit
MEPITRVDGRLKVTGAARYSGDLELPRLAHAALVGSTIARGRVVGLDVAAARRAPGVIAVLSAGNAPRLAAPAAAEVGSEAHQALQSSEVSFNGQPIAVVVAETPEQARYASTLVSARYETDTPFLSLADQAAPSIMPPARFGTSLQSGRGDPDAAFAADGARVVDEVYETPSETHNPMEPHATIAHWDGDRLTVHHATQAVNGTQQTLAGAFGIPPANVRVVCHFTGGGFGGKGSTWQPCTIAAMAARAVGRPVKLVLRRQDMFDNVGHRSATIQRVALAAEADGRLLGARHEVQSYTSPLQDFIEPCSLMTRMLYAAPTLGLSHRLARLNLSTPTFMRAPGEASGSFGLESAMDELAHQLGMDPVALRLACYAETDPDTGKAWSSKHLRECYQRGAERFGWSARIATPGSVRRDGRLVGMGMATATYPGNKQPASARVTITDDGTVTAASATTEIGQGNSTILSQIAAEALGVAVADVRFELGSSDLPPAPITAGSMTAASVGPTVALAARQLRDDLVALATADAASPLHGLAPARIAAADGRLASLDDAARTDTYRDILRRAGRATLSRDAATGAAPGDASNRECRTQDDEACWSFHSFGAQFAEVEVHPLTGEVRVTRFVGAFDVGRVLNPRTARSQGLGGIVMGIGQALMEDTVRDPRDGRVVTRNLADYHIPVQADIPAIDVLFIDEPDPHFNALGCRGAGELPMVGVAAAIANAVFNATGRRVRSLPITPDKLLS